MVGPLLMAGLAPLAMIVMVWFVMLQHYNPTSLLAQNILANTKIHGLLWVDLGLLYQHNLSIIGLIKD